MGSSVRKAEEGPGPDQHPTYRDHGGTHAGIERTWRQEWHYFFQNTRRWRDLRKVTIASVHGPVYAAGLMLMWACDLIVADETAEFADVVGTRLGMCGVEYFAHPWELGPRRAKELLLTGDSMTVEDAHRIGMVSKVFPAGTLQERTLESKRSLHVSPGCRSRHLAHDQRGGEPGAGRAGLLQRAAIGLHPARAQSRALVDRVGRGRAGADRRNGRHTLAGSAADPTGPARPGRCVMTGLAVGHDRALVDLVAGRDLDVDALTERYDHERRKRLRSQAPNAYVKAAPAAPAQPVVAAPRSTRTPIRTEADVVVIGAGFGGLQVGAALRRAGFERIRLIEAGSDVGGTWYWNRYPGAQCDIDSYIYLPLLEETGYLPTRKYAGADEIFAHAQRIAAHFDLTADALFDTTVTALEWDEDAASWQVDTDHGDRLCAQFVVIANGPLSEPKAPSIPGVHNFAGHTFHTSRWDYAYTGGNSAGDLTGLRDKRVGLIGTGATGIQVVPPLATMVAGTDGLSADSVGGGRAEQSAHRPRLGRFADPGLAGRADPQLHRADVRARPGHRSGRRCVDRDPQGDHTDRHRGPGRGAGSHADPG